MRCDVMGTHADRQQTHLVYMGMQDLKPSSIDSSCSEPVICSWRLSNCGENIFSIFKNNNNNHVRDGWRAAAEATVASTFEYHTREGGREEVELKIYLHPTNKGKKKQHSLQIKSRAKKQTKPKSHKTTLSVICHHVHQRVNASQPQV